MKAQANLRLAAGLLACAWLASVQSCAVVAVAGVGVAMSQEFMENSVSYYVPSDVETAWVSAKRVMDSMSMDPIVADEKKMAIEAVVEGSRVFVRVEAFDLQETKVQVMAKRLGSYQDDLASEIAHRVRDTVAPRVDN